MASSLDVLSPEVIEQEKLSHDIKNFGIEQDIKKIAEKIEGVFDYPEEKKWKQSRLETAEQATSLVEEIVEAMDKKTGIAQRICKKFLFLPQIQEDMVDFFSGIRPEVTSASIFASLMSERGKEERVQKLFEAFRQILHGSEHFLVIDNLKPGT